MLYLYAATALATALVVGTGTWKVQEWRHNSAELQRRGEEQRLLNKRVAQVDVAATKHEVAKTRIDREIVEVEKEVIRVVKEPFYVDAPMCLDPDGVRLVNQASGYAAPASGVAPPAVRQPPTTD